MDLFSRGAIELPDLARGIVRAARVLVLAFVLGVAAGAQELSADAHTRLLLHGNGDLSGAAGEVPVLASGVSFTSGVHGEGLVVAGAAQLAFSAPGEFEPAAGTIELWTRPAWDGVDGRGRTLFSVGGELVLAKDGADNLVFLIRLPDSEAFRAWSLAGWRAGEWHHVAATWEIPGSMRVYVDGFERIAHPSSGQDLLVPVPSLLWIGSREGSEQADAVFDEVRLSDVARSAAEIAQSFLAGPSVSAIVVEPVASTMYPTWEQTPHLRATTDLGPLELPPSAATWSTSDPLVATVDELGRVRAVAPGAVELSARVASVQDSAPITVAAPARPVEYSPIDPYLGTPAAGHRHEVPVLVLRFLPTQDGANLDVAWDPDFYELNPLTLAELEARIDAYDRRVKFMLEEGSRFRGYARAGAPPALGYRVVQYVTVFEPTPPGRVLGEVQGYPVYEPDFAQILGRFGVEELVNRAGVREVWFWSGGMSPAYPSYDPALHPPENFRVNWESNMSSPLTGDVSNSDRDPSDLPVYAHTYVVYGQNFRRTQAEAVHNHGHQLEAMLGHVDQLRDGSTELFWQRFVGLDAAFQWVQGRCGDTHHPPNALYDYDYSNPVAVESDIEDWNPAGTGRRLLVNADTWGTVPYAWPDRPPAEQLVESQWYIFWMQSMPGFANGIPLGADVLTDWWEFTADWDASIAGGLGLHGPPEAPSLAELVLAAGERLVLDSPDESAGDVHSNGGMRLKKGRKKLLSCDLTALGDILVERGNTIAGAATAGGEVSLERGAIVLGPVQSHAAVSPLTIPRPTFVAGGRDVTVEERQTLRLAPGSFGRVSVRRAGTLALVAGGYFFEELVTERDAVLACEVSAGTVRVNVTGELVLGERSCCRTSEGDAASARIELAVLQRSPLELGRNARVLGTLVAPEAAVRLGRGCRFQGTLWARAIEVEQGAEFRPHPPVGR